MSKSDKQQPPKQRPISAKEWAEALKKQEQRELEEGRRIGHKPGDKPAPDTIFE